MLVANQKRIFWEEGNPKSGWRSVYGSSTRTVGRKQLAFPMLSNGSRMFAIHWLLIGMAGSVQAHGRLDTDGVDIDRFPVNAALGVSGFPDCVR
jgi:hypothetical protein